MKWRISKRRKKLGDYASRSQEQKTIRNRKGIARRRAAATAILERERAKPCTDCGRHYPPCVMEFDHVEEKFECVGALAAMGWVNKVREEIPKCEIVCANCHRIRTYFRKLFKKALDRFLTNDYRWPHGRRD